MLCPEVWSFSAPENIINVKEGVLDGNVEKTLFEKRFFNEMVSIILPEFNELPKEIASLIESSDYYIVKDLKVSELVSKGFIEAFVKRGKLTAVSANITNNLDDSLVITPVGDLVLTVCRDIYECLGVQGTPILTSKKTKDFYTIHLKLNDISSVTYSNILKRVKDGFSKEVLQNIDLKLFWEPPNNSVCPSSIAKYFTDLGYEVEQHEIDVKLSLNKHFRAPKMDKASIHEIVEYVGLSLLECEIEDLDENLVSYVPEIELGDQKDTVICHCKGLFTTTFLENILEILGQICKTKWASFNVSGFQHIPKGESLGLKNRGDDDFMVILYPENRYMVFKSSGNNKMSK
ncbi:hypothetical protein ACFFRR_002600 [Megaselia abdita]